MLYGPWSSLAATPPGWDDTNWMISIHWYYPTVHCLKQTHTNFHLFGYLAGSLWWFTNMPKYQNLKKKNNALGESLNPYGIAGWPTTLGFYHLRRATLLHQHQSSPIHTSNTTNSSLQNAQHHFTILICRKKNGGCHKVYTFFSQIFEDIMEIRNLSAVVKGPRPKNTRPAAKSKTCITKAIGNHGVNRNDSDLPER